jgi:hypothetical protein
MEMSHLEGGKPGFPKWNGIIQQYDARENRLVGECRKIYAGSALGTTEGHISTNTTAGFIYRRPKGAPSTTMA